VPSLLAAFVAPGSQGSVYCLSILAFPAFSTPAVRCCLSSIAFSVAPPEPLSATGLASCVTQRTATIFHIFCVNGKTYAESFLAKDPTEWSDDPSYQELHRLCQRWRLWMTQLREPLHWCSNTTHLWRRMRNRSSVSFASSNVTSRMTHPVPSQNWWRWVPLTVNK